MNRKIGIVLIIFFCFLIWLYFAIYESSINNWWTVKEIKQRTEETVQIGVSLVRVLVGTAIFTLGGTLLYFVIGYVRR
jgi:hypothetical protein